MRISNPGPSALALGTSLWVTASAHASVVRYDFSGQITWAGGSVQVGDPFSGYLIADNTAIRLNGVTETVYTYQSLRITVGAEVFTLNFGDVAVDNNGVFAGDRVDAEYSAPGSIGGLPFSHARVRLVDTTSRALSSTSLIFTTDLSAWNFHEVRFYATGVDIIGEMSTLSMSVVPAPAISPLLAVAGLLTRSRRRA